MKKLFQGIRTDIKFKAAGPGHRLNEDRRDDPDMVSKEPKPPKTPPSKANTAAGSAAVARLETGHRKVKTLAKGTNEMQAAKQLEFDQEMSILPSCKKTTAAGKEFTTVCNVMFKCPLTGKLLRKDEKDMHIRKAIEMMSYTNPVSAAIMKIYTFNKDQERVKLGVDTVTKYLNNIIDNPNEEKYHAIRISNKVFQEKIKCLEGTVDFFEAIGFEKKTLPLPEQDIQDEFYVLSFKAEENLDNLLRYRDLLTSGAAIRATLDRQPRVFAPSLQAAKFDLPDDFYNLTVEEIKREQQLRKEKLARESVLRTKAMRQREEQREMKKYRYTVLRTKFPDGYILQGIFYAHEQLSTLFDFVFKHLQNDWIPYELIGPCGQKLEDENRSFRDCGLVPSALLIFHWDAQILADVQAAEGQKVVNALKKELIYSAETLE